MPTENPIRCTTDLEAPGKRHGHLLLPWSRDDSAWGSVMIPLTVVVGGAGPTALLTGGNHGDEYEGPVALFDLAHSLEPERVSGRVIIVPAMNYPAFAAARRTSPIDGGNLNRTFPGRPDGTVTEKIAHYFDTVLLPQADIALDYHSGGKTLDFVPFAAAHRLDDAAQSAACREAMLAFNAPYSVMMREIDAVGMFDTAAETKGKVFVTTELGGGGTSTAETVAIARKGARNLLRHAGILDGEPEIGPTVHLEMPESSAFSFAEESGLLEPVVDLGSEVRKGDLLARIFRISRTGMAPKEQRADADGILIGRHFPGLVKMGDCVAALAGIAG